MLRIREYSLTIDAMMLYLRQNHFSPFVYGLILMKICINANIMKTQIFHKLYNVNFMLLRSFVIF